MSAGANTARSTEVVVGSSRRTLAPPWRPGQSGNPAGRAKLPVHVRDLARAQTAKAIRALVRALGDKDPRVRVVAAEALLNRAWGKPADVPAASVSAAPVFDLSRLSERDRTELREIAARALGSSRAEGNDHGDEIEGSREDGETIEVIARSETSAAAGEEAGTEGGKDDGEVHHDEK